MRDYKYPIITDGDTLIVPLLTLYLTHPEKTDDTYILHEQVAKISTVQGRLERTIKALEKVKMDSVKRINEIYKDI